MAASPDDLASGEPPFTPSAFLDLPPTPRSHGEDDDDHPALPADLVFPVISRMLMEDTSEDELLLHQFPDHPSLLQAKQPFAQILSDTTPGTALSSQASSATNHASAAAANGTSSSLYAAPFADATWPYDPEELSRLLLSRTTCPASMGVGLDGFTAGDAIATLHRSSDEDGVKNTVITAAPAEDGEHCSSRAFSLFSSGQDRVNMDMLNMAFLKGMEEANKFLPTSDNLLIHAEAVSMNDLPSTSRVEEGTDGIIMSLLQARCNNGRGQKKCPSSWNDLEAEAGRKSKIMAPEPEENGEAVDKMIIAGYDSCMEKMKDLRISRITEAEKKTKGNNGKKLRSSNETHVNLCTLLIHCAQAMSMGNHETTTELLRQIKHQASPTGDATQRLAHCFTVALETRLAGAGSQVYRSLVAKNTSVVEYMKAYHLYLTACCFETMAYKFSGMSICNAVIAARKTKKKKVHIVDYGVRYGFQWPSVLAYMATWAGGPPAVRLTGVDLPRPGFRPSARTEETGRRLTAHAHDLGVPFEFRTVAAEWETVRSSDLNLDPDELLVVSSITGLGSTMTEGGGADVDTPSPRDVILCNISDMHPDVFVLCAVNGSHGGPLFVSRFREALFHYAAVFDMLGGTVPLDDGRRAAVERDLVGRSAMNVVACEGADRVERPETYRQWQTRCRRAGLRQLPLCPEIVRRLKEKVKKYYHKDFVVDVDREWLLQGWKGRILYAMSTWTADATDSK